MVWPKGRAASILKRFWALMIMTSSSLLGYSGGCAYARGTGRGCCLATRRSAAFDEPGQKLPRLEGALWLEKYLAKYPFYVIFHQPRTVGLLNRAVGASLHLGSRKLTYYQWNYDQYRKNARRKTRELSAAAKNSQATRRPFAGFRGSLKSGKASKGPNRAKQSRMKPSRRLVTITPPEEAARKVLHLPGKRAMTLSRKSSVENGSTGYTVRPARAVAPQRCGLGSGTTAIALLGLGRKRFRAIDLSKRCRATIWCCSRAKPLNSTSAAIRGFFANSIRWEDEKLGSLNEDAPLCRHDSRAAPA